MAKLSVVVPCYNQGEYIDETIESVFKQEFKDYEIIIIDDGSTDIRTINKLNSLKDPRLIKVTTSNQGLALARNNGIRVAKGEYILPLDADDKIGNGFLGNAVDILEHNKHVGIVYCSSETFGDVIGEWHLPKYRIGRMLLTNCIFCSGVFRKEDWEYVGGYNPCMKKGFEDWEFWLSLLELGRTVEKISDIGFFYRIKNESMLNGMSLSNKIAMRKEIFRLHRRLYFFNMHKVLFELPPFLFDLIRSKNIVNISWLE